METWKVEEQLVKQLLDALVGECALDPAHLEPHSLGDAAVLYEQITGERDAVTAVTEGKLEDAYAIIRDYALFAGAPL